MSLLLFWVHQMNPKLPWMIGLLIDGTCSQAPAEARGAVKKTRRLPASVVGTLIQLCKMRPHLLSKFGQRAVYAAAVEQMSTKFLFQSSDCIA